jgi:hypothetical protein
MLAYTFRCLLCGPASLTCMPGVEAWRCSKVFNKLPSHGRITPQAFIHTCIMIRKSSNILTMCENGRWCAHCRITPQAFIHRTCITVKKLRNILKQSVPSWHICSISFRASLPWCRFGGRWPVVLFYNEHSLHDFCKIGTLQVCMATFLVMLTVYRRHRIWSRRCPVNHMWLWSGWLMHVALMFVFVTMLLKTRRADKVSGAVWRIANFSFGGNCNLHWAINVCQKACSQIMLKDYGAIVERCWGAIARHMQLETCASCCI